MFRFPFPQDDLGRLFLRPSAVVPRSAWGGFCGGEGGFGAADGAAGAARGGGFAGAGAGAFDDTAGLDWGGFDNNATRGGASGGLGGHDDDDDDHGGGYFDDDDDDGFAAGRAFGDGAGAAPAGCGATVDFLARDTFEACAPANHAHETRSHAGRRR